MKDQRMAGKGSSSQKPSSSSNPTPSSSSSQKKSRWESNNPVRDAKPPSASASPAQPSSKPTPVDPLPPPGALHPPPSAISPFQIPDPGPPAPPAYGFHMLERRTIVLADGSVRSYFALPPDPPADPMADKFFPYGPSGAGHGIEPPPLLGGLGLGFDRNFPPPGHLSPDALRREREREELFGRGGPPLHDYWNPLDGRGLPRPGPDSSLKRKYGEDEGRDDFARQRQQLLQYGNPNPNGFPPGDGPLHRDPLEAGRRGMDDLRPLKHLRGGADSYDDLSSSRLGDVAGGAVVKHLDVDQGALKKAFLRHMKSLNENLTQKKNYLEDGKNGVLRCLVCDRDSKDYTDVHGLIMHAYNSQNARVEHLGFHKALCVLMGWNYMRAPDNSKTYQLLAEDEAIANKEDLIIWPPMVIIHNTNTGKRKDGRMDGMGNKEMDGKLKELGFGGGKSRSIYGKDGHMGITVVKFANSQSGMEEAERLADYFEKDNRGRKGWVRVEASRTGDNDDNNPYLVRVETKTGEKKRILYGYLGTAFDLDKVDFDTRKRATVKSKREFDPW